MNLTIDPELKALIPPPSAEELAGLEKSIVAEGCRDPLVYWRKGKTNILVDGHNRHALCERLKLPFEAVEREFATVNDAKRWMIDNQLSRRNLPAYVRVTLNEIRVGLPLAEIAKANLKKGGEEKKPLLNSVKAVDTTSEVAKASSVSRDTVTKVRKIEALADEATKQKLRANEISINEAHANVTREEKRAQIVERLDDIEAKEQKALAGTYDVIVIDPPWPMKKIERDVRPNQSEFDYPTMGEPEMAAMPMPAADDCHLWLWTTHKFMPVAFRLLDAWGFRYTCCFTWHKPGGFQPIGLPQYNCEFALYARRGSPKFIDTKALPTCFSAPRGKHSEKPGEFYDTVRRVTAGARIDIFNRRKIEGFDAWGKEAI